MKLIELKPKPLDLDENKIKKWVKEDLSVKVYADIDRAISLTANKIKQRLKSACEFYLRYKDNPKLLIKDNPEYRKLFESECVHTYVWRKIFWQYKYDPEKYNEWLFKLAFKDVLENEERDKDG